MQIPWWTATAIQMGRSSPGRDQGAVTTPSLAAVKSGLILSLGVSPSLCRPSRSICPHPPSMPFETVRFHLFYAKVAYIDQSVASTGGMLRNLCLQRGLMAHGDTNNVPVAHLIGFGAKEIADGRAVVRLAAGRHRANPLGTLHGGILCDIADAAMGMVFASTLAPG